jgi:hypothetical protein
MDVEYVDEHGELVVAPLATASQLRFEFFPTTRKPLSFKGQRSFSGSWWCATTRSHVAFRSWIARDRLIALDFDPVITAMAYRPLSLRWRADGVDHRYAPDYFVRRQDGTAELIDVRAGHADVEMPPVAAAALERTGWARSCVGPLNVVLAANLRWLAGYRHPRCGAGADARLVCAAFTHQRPLAEGLADIGDPLSARPVVFHLLWTGLLSTDLAGALLADESLVVAAADGPSA